MFYSITGTIVALDASFVAVSCAGVAFRINTSLNTVKHIGGVGNNTTLFIHTCVREDAIELFGFDTQEELDCFELLIGVSGVGPKAAVAILSVLPPAQLALSIASGDAASIKRAQGIGPKIAQRVVLELRDKMAKTIESGAISGAPVMDVGIVSASASAEEALAALLVLGYSRQEATRVLAKADEALSTEDKIKFALRHLGG
ncbi:MAG: Holliday junction branch migration protein RuvA [Clostridia bacterium]|nr:Holliday junction branch migration protein RuvA [Clostridia bacterium]